MPLPARAPPKRWPTSSAVLDHDELGDHCISHALRVWNGWWRAPTRAVLERRGMDRWRGIPLLHLAPASETNHERAASVSESLPDRERFGRSGGQAALRAVQQPTTATLAPDPRASMGPNPSEHVFVEGDNLEVLRVLQKAYCGTVKLIVIARPRTPATTSSTPTTTATACATICATPGLDADGARTTTATDRGGRIHSRWLSMMPRLVLAETCCATMAPSSSPSTTMRCTPCACSSTRCLGETS